MRIIGLSVKHQVVILSTADFDSAVWTNKQHLAVGLAETHDVVYVESLGLRQPTISVADLRRVLRKIVRLLLPKGQGRDGNYPSTKGAIPRGITVITPIIIPFHKYAVVRFVNARILHLQVSKLASESTLWTFSPLTYGLERRFDKVIYHSVDLLHTLPRVPSELLQEAEVDLARKADHIIASSRGVLDHLVSAGASEVLLWENVAHVEAFTAATGQPRRDRAVFAGNLTPSKIDLHCLQSVLDSGIELAIAGPIDIDGSGSPDQINALLDNPLVTYYGNLALTELIDLLATSKVGLIPYGVNEYTKGVFPMKVFEYLAAGLSIASTSLPSFIGRPIPNLHIGAPADFGNLTARLIAEQDDSRIEQSIAASLNHSWTSRIRQAVALIDSKGN